MKSKKQTNKQTNLTWLKNCSDKCAEKYFLSLMSGALNRNVKNCYQKKKVKDKGHITLFMDHYSKNG